MKHDENLRTLFNIEPAQPAVEQLPVPVYEEPKSSPAEEEDEDFVLARQTMRKILQKSEGTLDELLYLAREGEHPRPYEVAGQLMKTMSEVSKDLLALHGQRKQLKGPSEQPSQQINQQNNIVFAGSTNDLLEMLKNKDDPTKIIDQS